MATKKTKKKAVKMAKKAAKNNPKLFAILVVLVLIGLGVVVALYFLGIITIPGLNDNKKDKNSTPLTVNGEVQIYSIEMHEKYGDSLFIKYKDYDILIDSGDNGDGKYVRDFVDQYISSDKNLDLLIATHMHADHLGGLAKKSNSDSSPKALDNVSTVSNIIDFGHQRSDYALYKSYDELRSKYISLGAKYYPAYEAVHGLDGLTNTIEFDDLKIEIIDTNNYLSKSTDINGDTYKYNVYSVATLITYKNTKLFCAGDLEDVGEKNLIENANNTSLKNIKDSDTVIYKACHHGTDVGSANNKTSGATSSNGGNRMALLKIIKPDFCFVSSTIGESPHPFVRALGTMLYFTDKVYFNGTMGTICFDLDGTNVGVQGMGATTNYTLEGFTIDYEAEKNLPYTETLWYNNHVYTADKSWYNGTGTTDKELTEWYLNKLKTDFGI